LSIGCRELHSLRRRGLERLQALDDRAEPGRVPAPQLLVERAELGVMRFALAMNRRLLLERRDDLLDVPSLLQRLLHRLKGRESTAIRDF
jgi:hypothetical protein